MYIAFTTQVYLSRPSFHWPAEARLSRNSEFSNKQANVGAAEVSVPECEAAATFLRLAFLLAVSTAECSQARQEYTPLRNTSQERALRAVGLAQEREWQL